MIQFAQSKRRYEGWLRKQLGKDFVAADLAEKNRLMKDSAFVFLRGTYWRWAELSLDVFPDLADAPAVLAVGDIHLENFGSWRDVDGRLVWGVNDFDEAATMPFALDLVRLAASAALAADARNTGLAELCDAILGGYRDGVEAPSPVVLDRHWTWLRDKVVVPEDVRQKFWKKIDARQIETAPARFRQALREAMPQPGIAFDTARRLAGTGSLGRPRWIAVAEWQGAPIVREAKAVLTSGWALAHGRPNEPVHIGEIAAGRYRSPDPWYRLAKGVVTRRLSPNNRKIEASTIGPRLHGERMLSAMGFELANIHLATKGAQAAIAKDLRARKSGWLSRETERATAAVLADYKQFKKL
jgi:hypothetical protein